MKKILICLVLAVSLLASANARADMELMLIPGNLFAHDGTLSEVATVMFWGNNTHVHTVIRHGADIRPGERVPIEAGVNTVGSAQLAADFTNWTSPSGGDGTNTWSAIRIWGTGNIVDLHINGVRVATDWLTDWMPVTVDWSDDRGFSANLESAANDAWSFWYFINTDANEVLDVLFNVNCGTWLVGITIYERGNPYVIPEPATLAVVGLGLAGLGLARIRRKK